MEIPDKLFFTIGEVSRLTGIKSYVLRYWENEFPALRPKKSNTGQRRYRKKDIELIMLIKRLLYQEGYTIQGAKKKIAQDRSLKKDGKNEKRNVKKESNVSILDPATLRKELLGMLQILNSR
jgi:DNA-binding transcriptional MerR regulator